MLGLSFALIPLLIGIAAKSQASLMSGLLVAAIASWSTPFIMEAVEGAYERYEDGPRISYLDADIEVWLHIHEERAETWSKLLYLTAAIASLILIISLVKFSYALKFSWVLVLLCIASTGACIYITDSGGQIRRVNFRTNAPNQTSQEHHNKDH